MSVHDTQSGSKKTTFTHRAAVLDCCVSDRFYAFSGGLDRAVKMLDLTSSNDSVVGYHDKAVKCVGVCGSTHLLMSGSWDKTFKLWDVRQSNALVGTHSLPDRVFSMSVCNGKAVVATAGRHVMVYDLARPDAPLQQRVSSLKFQTRHVRCFPDATGYALSSIDGRVAIEYFDESPAVQAQKYAFKCHREEDKETKVDTVYPVNAIAFHPTYTRSFATGGCDGNVFLWDAQNRRRLKKYQQLETSIASLAFSTDGTQLAVAASYTFEEGEKDHPPDQVYIRAISESEVQPKARK